jgi:uncharacterized protein (TIGR00725 family)
VAADAAPFDSASPRLGWIRFELASFASEEFWAIINEMGHRFCVAVVGPGDDASPDAIESAAAVGKLIAEHGWALLSGGRDAGVMRAATRSAARAGGVTIGILPGSDRRDAAPDLTVALPTGLGEARNAILVTAADAIVACGMSPGTASEVALALRAHKPTVLVRPAPESAAFFAGAHHAATPEDAVAWVAVQLG